MIIPISDEWRITADRYNWIVQKYAGIQKDRRTGAAGPAWDAISFHQSLGSAAKSMAVTRLRLAPTVSLAEAVDAWESIASEIDEAFERWRSAA